MPYFLLPLERPGLRIVAFDEVMNHLTELANRTEVGSAQGLSAENAEPVFDLIQPSGMGWSKVKVDVGVTGQPAVVFGFVRTQIVRNDMDLLARVVASDQSIHNHG